jgi:release factor glutamine methyltransferase
MHFLKLSATELILSGERILENEEIERIQRGIDKLLLKMPIQYITENAQFLDLNLKVNQNVLIPRPETEELVLWVSDFLKDESTISVLDICTGSGCIALGLKHQNETWKVFASDISYQAIEITNENAKKHNLDIQTFNHDILHHPVPDEWNEVEVIVSNPPYILHLEKRLMEENVLKYEPELALFVDDDKPLIFYEKIIEVSMTLPKCKYCFFEINEFQADNLIQYLNSKYLQWLIKRDFNDKNRMLMIKTK